MAQRATTPIPASGNATIHAPVHWSNRHTKPMCETRNVQIHTGDLAKTVEGIKCANAALYFYFLLQISAVPPGGETQDYL